MTDVVKRLLTTQELADRLQVTPHTLRKWVRQGMPVIKNGRIVRFDSEDVALWLKEDGNDLVCSHCRTRLQPHPDEPSLYCQKCGVVVRDQTYKPQERPQRVVEMSGTLTVNSSLASGSIPRI